MERVWHTHSYLVSLLDYAMGEEVKCCGMYGAAMATLQTALRRFPAPTRKKTSSVQGKEKRRGQVVITDRVGHILE